MEGMTVHILASSVFFFKGAAALLDPLVSMPLCRSIPVSVLEKKISVHVCDDLMPSLLSTNLSANLCLYIISCLNWDGLSCECGKVRRRFSVSDSMLYWMAMGIHIIRYTPHWNRKTRSSVFKQTGKRAKSGADKSLCFSVCVLTCVTNMFENSTRVHCKREFYKILFSLNIYSDKHDFLNGTRGQSFPGSRSA